MDNASIKNFYKRFPNDAVCLKYLEAQRWPEGLICPMCASQKVYQFKDGKLYKCGDCKKQFSVKSGTIFAESHIAVQDWLLAIHLLCANPQGISSVQLADELQITQKSAWLLVSRIRGRLEQAKISAVTNPVKREKPYGIALPFEATVKQITATPK